MESNIVLYMAIQTTSITTDVLTNRGPQMISVFADDVDALGEVQLKIEEESNKVGLTINEDKTK